MKLYIGNKNYSSWSMRPWVLLTALEIPFEEIIVRFDSFAADSEFKQTILPVNPGGTVPVLADGPLVITDSLAMVDYIQDTKTHVWPVDIAQRVQARNLTCLMHSGFSHLRRHCPMNIEADLGHVGAALFEIYEGLRDDLKMLDAVLGPHLRAADEPAGPLFGQFTAVDAFYAPVMMRLNSYHLPVSPALRAYADYITAHPAVQAWCRAARNEKDFLDFEEPYRTSANDSSALGVQIRPYAAADADEVVALWEACALTRPWNEPYGDIRLKLTVQPDMFSVMVKDTKIIGSVMAAFDGHRGAINYLAVDPACQKAGYGRLLMQHAEAQLKAIGCPKINLQVRNGNEAATAFYQSIGYEVQDTATYGKWLQETDQSV